MHAILEAIQIQNYCKISGARGLHVAVPMQGRYTYEQVKRCAELVALIYRQLSKITSLERSPKKRQKRVYIDCYQNNFWQMLAAPYSVRARPGAPVSTPLLWNEVKKGDLFKPVLQRGVDLKKALKHLQKFF